MIIKQDENYSISETGVVTNITTGVIKKSQIWQGYSTVQLWVKGNVKNLFIHRLVAIAFVPNPYNKPFINHKNGIRSDNALENLEWCTHQENMQHAYDTGLHIPHRKKCNLGEKGGMCKITEEIARDIINSTDKQRSLAEKYGISQTQVHRIKSRKRWGHLV